MKEMPGPDKCLKMPQLVARAALRREFAEEKGVNSTGAYCEALEDEVIRLRFQLKEVEQWQPQQQSR